MTSFVQTIADLKSLPTVGVSPGEIVQAGGFYQGGDGFGGDFVFCLPNQPAPAYLDGYLMAGASGGEWRRVDAGPVHTRWVGIRPTTNANVFDAEGFASDNIARWIALNTFASKPVFNWLGTGVAPIVTQGIVVDPGIHDMGNGVIRIGDGLCVSGAGSSISLLRTRHDTGGDAVLIDGGSEYGANVKLSDWGLKRFERATSEAGFGLRVRRMVRGLKISDFTISGFGRSIHFEDCWEYELDNVWAQSGFRSHFSSVGAIGNAWLRGCRFDDLSDDVGAIVVNIEDSTNSGRNVSISNCSVQRSPRLGIRIKGVRGFEVARTHFEGLNRADGFHPDIWIEPPANTFVGEVKGNTFTTAGRFDATTNRAINVRSSAVAGSVLNVSGNGLSGGAWVNFLDIDANVAMRANWLGMNDTGSVVSTVPSNVIQK